VQGARPRRGGGDAGTGLGADGELLLLPQGALCHIRTTNVVESPFTALRLRRDAAKRFKRVDRATAVIWRMLTVAQQRFRRLNAPQLPSKVYAGVNYQDGIEVAREEAAA
jgi:putative transposase